MKMAAIQSGIKIFRAVPKPRLFKPYSAPLSSNNSFTTKIKKTQECHTKNNSHLSYKIKVVDKIAEKKYKSISNNYYNKQSCNDVTLFKMTKADLELWVISMKNILQLIKKIVTKTEDLLNHSLENDIEHSSNNNKLLTTKTTDTNQNDTTVTTLPTKSVIQVIDHFNKVTKITVQKRNGERAERGNEDDIRESRNNKQDTVPKQLTITEYQQNRICKNLSLNEKINLELMSFRKMYNDFKLSRKIKTRNNKHKWWTNNNLIYENCTEILLGEHILTLDNENQILNKCDESTMERIYNNHNINKNHDMLSKSKEVLQSLFNKDYNFNFKYCNLEKFFYSVSYNNNFNNAYKPDIKIIQTNYNNDAILSKMNTLMKYHTNQNDKNNSGKDNDKNNSAKDNTDNIVEILKKKQDFLISALCNSLEVEKQTANVKNNGCADKSLKNSNIKPYEPCPKSVLKQPSQTDISEQLKVSIKSFKMLCKEIKCIKERQQNNEKLSSNKSIDSDLQKEVLQNGIITKKKLDNISYAKLIRESLKYEINLPDDNDIKKRMDLALQPNCNAAVLPSDGGGRKIPTPIHTSDKEKSLIKKFNLKAYSDKILEGRINDDKRKSTTGGVKAKGKDFLRECAMEIKVTGTETNEQKHKILPTPQITGQQNDSTTLKNVIGSYVNGLVKKDNQIVSNLQKDREKKNLEEEMINIKKTSAEDKRMAAKDDAIINKKNKNSGVGKYVNLNEKSGDETKGQEIYHNNTLQGWQTLSKSIPPTTIYEKIYSINKNNKINVLNTDIKGQYKNRHQTKKGENDIDELSNNKNVNLKITEPVIKALNENKKKTQSQSELNQIVMMKSPIDYLTIKYSDDKKDIMHEGKNQQGFQQTKFQQRLKEKPKLRPSFSEKMSSIYKKNAINVLKENLNEQAEHQQKTNRQGKNNNTYERQTKKIKLHTKTTQAENKTKNENTKTLSQSEQNQIALMKTPLDYLTIQCNNDRNGLIHKGINRQNLPKAEFKQRSVGIPKLLSFFSEKTSSIYKKNEINVSTEKTSSIYKKNEINLSRVNLNEQNVNQDQNKKGKSNTEETNKKIKLQIKTTETYNKTLKKNLRTQSQSEINDIVMMKSPVDYLTVKYSNDRKDLMNEDENRQRLPQNEFQQRPVAIPKLWPSLPPPPLYIMKIIEENEKLLQKENKEEGKIKSESISNEKLHASAKKKEKFDIANYVARFNPFLMIQDVINEKTSKKSLSEDLYLKNTSVTRDLIVIIVNMVNAIGNIIKSNAKESDVLMITSKSSKGSELIKLPKHNKSIKEIKVLGNPGELNSNRQFSLFDNKHQSQRKLVEESDAKSNNLLKTQAVKNCIMHNENIAHNQFDKLSINLTRTSLKETDSIPVVKYNGKIEETKDKNDKGDKHDLLQWKNRQKKQNTGFPSYFNGILSGKNDESEMKMSQTMKAFAGKRRWEHAMGKEVIGFNENLSNSIRSINDPMSLVKNMPSNYEIKQIHPFYSRKSMKANNNKTALMDESRKSVKQNTIKSVKQDISNAKLKETQKIIKKDAVKFEEKEKLSESLKNVKIPYNCHLVGRRRAEIIFQDLESLREQNPARSVPFNGGIPKNKMNSMTDLQSNSLKNIPPFGGLMTEGETTNKDKIDKDNQVSTNKQESVKHTKCLNSKKDNQRETDKIIDKITKIASTFKEIKSLHIDPLFFYTASQINSLDINKCNKINLNKNPEKINSMKSWSSNQHLENHDFSEKLIFSNKSKMMQSNKLKKENVKLPTTYSNKSKSKIKVGKEIKTGKNDLNYAIKEVNKCKIKQSMAGSSQIQIKNDLNYAIDEVNNCKIKQSVPSSSQVQIKNDLNYSIEEVNSQKTKQSVSSSSLYDSSMKKRTSQLLQMKAIWKPSSTSILDQVNQYEKQTIRSKDLINRMEQRKRIDNEKNTDQRNDSEITQTREVMKNKWFKSFTTGPETKQNVNFKTEYIYTKNGKLKFNVMTGQGEKKLSPSEQEIGYLKAPIKRKSERAASNNFKSKDGFKAPAFKLDINTNMNLEKGKSKQSTEIYKKITDYDSFFDQKVHTQIDYNKISQPKCRLQEAMINKIKLHQYSKRNEYRPVSMNAVNKKSDCKTWMNDLSTMSYRKESNKFSNTTDGTDEEESNKITTPQNNQLQVVMKGNLRQISGKNESPNSEFIKMKQTRERNKKDIIQQPLKIQKKVNNNKSPRLNDSSAVRQRISKFRLQYNPIGKASDKLNINQNKNYDHVAQSKITSNSLVQENSQRNNSLKLPDNHGKEQFKNYKNEKYKNKKVSKVNDSLKNENYSQQLLADKIMNEHLSPPVPFSIGFNSSAIPINISDNLFGDIFIRKSYSTLANPEITIHHKKFHSNKQQLQLERRIKIERIN